jgi:hypothetical protein
MARLPEPICARDFASGRLRRVLAGYAPPPMAVYTTYSSRRTASPVSGSQRQPARAGAGGSASWYAPDVAAHFALKEPQRPALQSIDPAQARR